MSITKSDISHDDISSIVNFINESLEEYQKNQQYLFLENAFQYIEHFEKSNYNFMNINSSTNDIENQIYSFNVNETYFQFNKSNPDSLLITSCRLLCCMKNCYIYLQYIKNKAENYTFDYIQELIILSYNNIMSKYINLYNFIKIINKNPIHLTDVMLFFNNAVNTFNDKFEILKVFSCVDNFMYVHYFDVKTDFSKTCILKIAIPQIRINISIDICNSQSITSCNSIFSSAYNLFHNTSSISETTCFINTDISCNAEIDYYTFDPCNCANTYVYDPSFCTHNHTYSIETNQHTHIYNTGMCVHTIIYDSSLCIHTHIYDPNKCPHKYVYDPCNAIYCDNNMINDYDCSLCDCTDISYCTHKHVFDTSENTLYIDEDIHTVTRQYNTFYNTYIYVYDISDCVHTLTYDCRTKTFTHLWNEEICDHKHVFDHYITNLYNRDCSNNMVITYCPLSCSHDETHIYNYGNGYMCGTMKYIHKYCGVINDSCNIMNDHGFTNPLNTIICKNYSETCNSTNIYDNHLIHGPEHFKTWDNFVKIIYGLFDSEKICLVNQSDFILLLGNDYVRFSECDLNTDIFYSKLNFYVMGLNAIINSDFGSYKVACNSTFTNLFDREKLILFQNIYNEYLEFIQLLKEDIESLQTLSSNNGIVENFANTINRVIIENTSIRFENLYKDVKRNIEFSIDGNKFDIYYIDYNNCVSKFASNFNVNITQYISMGKIVKLVLNIDTATIVLEEFNSSYTYEMLRTLCINNLSNITAFKNIIGLNLKNINDLLKKKYE